MFEESSCVLRMQKGLFSFLIGCISTDVLYGDWKGVILLALLCDVSNSVQEKLFILTIFTL